MGPSGPTVSDLSSLGAGMPASVVVWCSVIGPSPVQGDTTGSPPDRPGIRRLSRSRYRLAVRRSRRWRRNRGRPARATWSITRSGGPETRPGRFVSGTGGPETGRWTVMHHARTVMPAVPVPAVAGEIDGGAAHHRGDEDRSGDDHHPGRGLVQPVRLVRRRWR